MTGWTKIAIIWGWLWKKRTRALLYHSISETPSDPFAVSPANFRHQLAWLADSGYQVISHRQFLENLNQGRSLARSLVITFDDGFEDFYLNAFPLLQEFGFSAIVFIPTALVGSPQTWNPAYPSRKLMSQDQIHHLLESGFEIGSHTAHHRSLPSLDDQALHQELGESLHYLQSLPRQQSACLAYPYGRAGRREQHAARQLGYTSAYLAGGLWGNGRHSDLFALSRCLVAQQTDFQQFKKLVTGSSDLPALTASIFQRKTNLRNEQNSPTAFR